jgi:hypothetical protein
LKKDAASLLANALLPLLFDELRGETIAAWESASAPDKREQFWQQLKVLEAIRDHINRRARAEAAEA